MFGIKENCAIHVLIAKNKTQYTFIEHARILGAIITPLCTIFFVPYLKLMSAPYWYYKRVTMLHDILSYLIS